MSQFSEIIIWDKSIVPELSEAGGRQIVFWQSYETRPLKLAISIPQLVEKNAVALRSSYLSWIFDLGKIKVNGKTVVDCLKIRSGFSYWWMTHLAEKCNWAKSPWISDAIRLFAFTQWAEDKDINRIKLISSKPELAKSLSLWCENRGVKFEWKKVIRKSCKSYLPQKMFFVLPRPVQAGFWLLHYLIKRFPLKGIGLKKWRIRHGEVLFVSYLFNLLPKKLKESKYASHYWGSLPNYMHKKRIRTRWLHDYIPNSLLPNARRASGFLKLLNRTSKKREIHVAVDSFLSMAVILRTLRDWILISCCALRLGKLPRLSSEYLSPLFVKDLRESFFGISSIRNLLHLNLFEDAMRSLPRQKIGFYLQENQPWEAALIYSWRQAGHGKIVGIPHSTVRFWDLRYFTDQRSFLDSKETKVPRPDILAVNGSFMKNQFLKSNYPKNEIREVEALRYLNLRNNTTFKKNNQSKNQIIRLLVLGDYLENDTKKMLNCLNEAVPKVKKNLLITFKGHPACSIKLKTNLIFPAKITDDPIVRLAKTHDLVFTSSVTSAAVDAYCSGLCVLTFLDSESLNLSPLRETHDFIRIENSSSLAQKINYFTKKKEKQVKFFYQNKKLVKWKKLLKTLR